MGWSKIVSLAALFLAFGPRALAQQPDADISQEGPSSLAPATAGAFSPLVLGASLGTARALVFGNGGYDTARSGALFNSAAEVRIWGPLSLRAEVTYSHDTKRMRPAAGARVQLLRQPAHGLDLTLNGFFKTEGFDEPEGEIETIVAVGRRFEHVYVLANLAYGQDPEGNERDGEVRGSVLRPQGRFVWGVEARARRALGAQHGKNSALEPRFDLVGGPLAMVTFGSFAVVAEAGPSAVRFDGGGTRWGIASTAGVASVF